MTTPSTPLSRAGRALSSRALPWANPEQAIILNRLSLAMAVLIAAAIHAHFGDAEATDYFQRGLPFIQVYIALVGLPQAHLALYPAPNAARRTISVLIDVAFVSSGLAEGGAAAAYLAPLYFWMILGYGVRLGPVCMGVAVSASLAGFAAVVWRTPFWRDNAVLSAGFFCALIVIPAYGAALLGRLREALSEAERANRAKTQMLANVSHELRTPLTAIIGLGDLLKKSGLNPEQREMAQTISGAADILLRHIEALLSVARDQIGDGAASAQSVDLFALLMSLRSLLAVEADKKGLRLGLCLDADLPRHVVCEPGLLLDVLQNLGGNAVKFTDEGSVAISVRASKREEDEIVLRFEVRDSGIGIDRQDQARIFEPFVQAGRTIAQKFGGAGLGLAIVRRRIEDRGGRIGVESAIGKGATFWFEIAATPCDAGRADEPIPALAPALRLDDSSGTGEAQRRVPTCVVAPDSIDPLALAASFAIGIVAREGDGDSIGRGRRIAACLDALAHGIDVAGDSVVESRPAGLVGMRILLAEDNGVNRRILATILAGGGFDVTAVEDGHAALDVMLAESFDLILLDLNLPRIGGLDVARLYRFGVPDGARAPVMALTADASPERRADCLDAGMADCLTKPVAPEALLAAVDRVLLAGEPQRPSRAQSPIPPARRPAAVVTPAALDALARLGGEEFLAEVIAQFLAEGEETALRMAGAVEEGDFDAFRRLAHALESSARHVGAEALADLCRCWSAATPDVFALDGDDYLDDLRIEWAHAAQALRDGLARRPAAA
jgi:two-component system sensor histidine kinase RpfC